MHRPLLTRAVTAFLLVLLTTPYAEAAPSTCTAVPSISNCAAFMTSKQPRSHASVCSSILGCTTTPTRTLTGTVTTTSTSVVVQQYTFEELGEIFETTETYSWTETETAWPVTHTITATSFYIEKFIVTTVTPRKREEIIHAKNLVARATTTNLCPSPVQSKACSCVITCPTTVTKDMRKTIKEKTTETSYSITVTSVPYTDVFYDPVISTETAYLTWTTTEFILNTNTRTEKCTPSVSNPSFYLKATNVPTVPDVDDKYVQAFPNPFHDNLIPSHKLPHFTSKDLASIFYLDSKSRLLTPGKNGTSYAYADDYNDFQLFHWLDRGAIQANSKYFYANCVLNPPSGKYAGGYEELTCETKGFWQLRFFQFCPLYVEFFETGLVLGAERSPESPDCLDIVFLVVPVCQ